MMTATTFEFALGGLAPRRPARDARRVLWIDSDDGAVEPGLQMLRRHGYDVTRAGTVDAARPLLADCSADLIILDTALPDGDGLALCRSLSDSDVAAVILFSARAETLDRVEGLEFGADDVLAKTTHPLELLARVRALLRRSDRQARSDGETEMAWRFDAELGYVTAASGRAVRLSPADAALLRVLVARPGEMLSRDDLIAQLHSGPAIAGGRSIDARVARLRRALNTCDGAGDFIKTLRGGGYLFKAQVTCGGAQEG